LAQVLDLENEVVPAVIIVEVELVIDPLVRLTRAPHHVLELEVMRLGPVSALGSFLGGTGRTREDSRSEVVLAAEPRTEHAGPDMPGFESIVTHVEVDTDWRQRIVRRVLLGRIQQLHGLGTAQRRVAHLGHEGQT